MKYGDEQYKKEVEAAKEYCETGAFAGFRAISAALLAAEAKIEEQRKEIERIATLLKTTIGHSNSQENMCVMIKEIERLRAGK